MAVRVPHVRPSGVHLIGVLLTIDPLYHVYQAVHYNPHILDADVPHWAELWQMLYKTDVDIDMQDGWYGIPENGRFNHAYRGALYIIGEDLLDAQNAWKQKC